ncbi:hypothetical protein BKA57DRAFT_446689 [Linnemannia elongata]|nr:hypothetical protein BKA57DRAFT_446689 [Linnemannia elongata]
MIWTFDGVIFSFLFSFALSTLFCPGGRNPLCLLSFAFCFVLFVVYRKTIDVVVVKKWQHAGFVGRHFFKKKKYS